MAKQTVVRDTASIGKNGRLKVRVTTITIDDEGYDYDHDTQHGYNYGSHEGSVKKILDAIYDYERQFDFN